MRLRANRSELVHGLVLVLLLGFVLVRYSERLGLETALHAVGVALMSVTTAVAAADLPLALAARRAVVPTARWVLIAGIVYSIVLAVLGQYGVLKMYLLFSGAMGAVLAIVWWVRDNMER